MTDQLPAVFGKRRLGFWLAGLLLLVGFWGAASTVANAIVIDTAPASCAELREIDSAAQDGVYTIAPNGNVFEVYCAGMNEEPQEYLELYYTGGTYNYSSFAPGGEAGGEGVLTKFTKVRIDPFTLKLDTGDFAFAASEGIIVSGNLVLTQIPFGEARSCSAEQTASGKGNIDLRGTPFAIAAQRFHTVGAEVSGGAQYSAYSQIVDLEVNGLCGHTAPVEQKQQGQQGQQGQEGAFLQLEYRPISVRASTSPLSAEGWSKTDVTVTAQCWTAPGTEAYCPPPVVVTSEGAGQETVMTVTYDVYTVSDSASFSIDKTPPSLTLLGAENVYLFQYDDYIEQGATAYDQLAGDLNAAITISGTVDTSVAGIYPLRYAVTDLAGNEAETYRTVYVSSNEQEMEPVLSVPEGLISFDAQQGRIHLMIPNGLGLIEGNVRLDGESVGFRLEGTAYTSEGDRFVVEASEAGPFSFQLVLVGQNNISTASYEVEVTRTPSLFGMAMVEDGGNAVIVKFRQPLYSDGNETLDRLRLWAGEQQIETQVEWAYEDQSYATLRLGVFETLSAAEPLFISIDPEGLRTQEHGRLSWVQYPVFTQSDALELRAKLRSGASEETIGISDVVRYLQRPIDDKDVTKDETFDRYDVQLLLRQLGAE